MFYCGIGLTEDEEDKVVNIWSLLAYNYIWYTEYRQQYYDEGYHLASPGYQSYMFNADWLSCDQPDTADLIRSSYSGFSGMVYSMCQMRYRCWKKDLFTGLFPSTQFGALSTIGISGHDLFTLDGSVTGYDVGRWQRVSGDSLAASHDVQTLSSNSLKEVVGDSFERIRHNHAIKDDDLHIGYYENGLNIDVLQLRKADAVQIWRENALRAGNYLEDNFRAHYGQTPQSHMHRHPVHIGSIDAPLNIGDIDSHAQTGSGSNQQLADVAGKGISSLGKGSFNFQTSEFGVILGLVSMLPETEYMSTGIDRDNQLLEREDYYIPEYTRLGLQPVDSSTFYFGGNSSVNLGYAPHDWGYKQKIDKVHLDFFNTSSELGVFRSWASPKYDVYDALEYIHTHQTGAFPLSCLYVNPELFDVNFSVGVETSRQFLVNYFFDTDGIQPLPVSGMPSY